MKRVLIIILCFVMLCFIIPIIFSNKKNVKTAKLEQGNKQIEENYEYNKYKTVKLLHKETGEVEEVAMDEYLLRSGLSGDASKL